MSTIQYTEPVSPGLGNLKVLYCHRQKNMCLVYIYKHIPITYNAQYNYLILLCIIVLLKTITKVLFQL